jgi:hypothetical protein
MAIDSLSECTICLGSGRVSIEYQNHTFPNELMFSMAEVAICNDCGFGSIVPEPSNHGLSDFYGARYRTPGNPYEIKFNELRPDGLNDDLDFRGIAQLSLASQHCDLTPDDYILDIGAGSGELFRMAKHLFPGTALLALESNPEAEKAYSRCFNAVSIPSLERLKRLQIQPKVVVMSHSLEHFTASQLHSLLRDIASVTASDGALVIEVPNDDFRNSDYRHLNMSPHTCFFSRESLVHLLSDTGWSVCQINTVASPLGTVSPPLVAASASSGRGKSWALVTAKRLPKPLRQLLRAAWATTRVSEPRPWPREQIQNLVYGPGRDCLRLVAKPISRQLDS